jgi:hypothetical protein
VISKKRERDERTVRRDDSRIGQHEQVFSEGFDYPGSVAIGVNVVGAISFVITLAYPTSA